MAIRMVRVQTPLQMTTWFLGTYDVVTGLYTVVVRVSTTTVIFSLSIEVAWQTSVWLLIVVGTQMTVVSV